MKRRRIGRWGAVLVGLLPALASSDAGAYPRPGGTERVSVAFDGAEPNWLSAPSNFVPVSLSGNGRYVAFTSLASNLVSDDTNGEWDVFVHDRVSGRTERVSVPDGGGEAEGRSHSPDISDDGRYVAFASSALNLVSGDVNGVDDAFVHDRLSGGTFRVSVASDGTAGDSQSYRPVISGDGTAVAFVSNATNLVPGDTNANPDIFVHELDTGLTERVNVTETGEEASEATMGPAISADGRYVAFNSWASNLVPGDTNTCGTGSCPDVFVSDRAKDTLELVSVSNGGEGGNGSSLWPSLSDDGRYVAFHSNADNLVPADTNGWVDVFVHDRQTRVTGKVSVSSGGVPGKREGGPPNTGDSLSPSVSADGRYVAFVSRAYNLVPGDTNGQRDVFVHDRLTGATERVSLAASGGQADAGSAGDSPSISGDGRYVAFPSDATNLVPGDTGGWRDVFVRDRGQDLGVGRATAIEDAQTVSVSGWATFSGTVVSSAADALGDAPPGAYGAGAEILGASVAARPEQEDLLFRIRLARLPAAVVPGQCSLAGCVEPSVTGPPGILYFFEATVGGVRYQVRAQGLAASRLTPGTAVFTLHRCEPTCAEVATLEGGFGTTGSEIVVSVPLTALGIAGEPELTQVRAVSAAGESYPGPVAVLDEVRLPSAPVPAPSVSLAVAPVGTPPEGAAFGPAALSGGSFTAVLDGSGVAPGSRAVWARTCLGDSCEIVFVPTEGQW